MLRQATTADRELVLSMGLKFGDNVALRDFIDPAKIAALVDAFLSPEDDSRTVFLCDDIGMLAACVIPFAFGTAPTAMEVVWWVEPEYRKQNIGQQLIEAYETWAKSKGCKLITMACYADTNLGPFYEKCGYSLYELGYLKCLP